MPTISDYLLKSVSNVVQAGVWVRLTNNVGGATFVSTTATDSNGEFTVNSVPAGVYTVATGPTSTGAWTNTGDANYVVSDPFDKTFASNPASAFALTQSGQGVLMRPFQLTPFKPGSALFQIVQNDALFNGVRDQFCFFGYNAERAAGGAGVASEPLWYEAFEAAYNDGTNLLCEWYINYNSPDNTTVVNFRPFGTQVLRNNNASWEAHSVIDIGAGAGAFLNIQTDPLATVLWAFLPTQTVTNWPFVVSRADTGSQAQIKLNTRLGDAALIFQDNGGFNWEYVMAHLGNFRLRDLVNNRDQVIYTAGATAAAAIAEFSARVKIDSFGAWASGDKYVVADASGNLHLSGLGPAS